MLSALSCTTRPPCLRLRPCCCAQLEIKAYLEAMYGMKVERVQTINYLGKLRQLASQVPGSHKVSGAAGPAVGV
jgi:hypothetical protein